MPRNKRITKRHIEDTLMKLGIPCDLVGFKNMVQAVLSIQKDEKKTFRQICLDLNRDPRAMSKNITTAISLAKADPKSINYYFGSTKGAAHQTWHFYTRLKDELSNDKSNHFVTRDEVIDLIENYLKENLK